MTSDDRVGAVFESHAARLFAYARRYGPPELAEDLVSEAFVVAVRRQHDFPDDAGEAYAWLVGTVRKIAANQRRRDASYDRYWREAVRTYWCADTSDSPETIFAERDACLSALAHLSESDRDLLLLVAWDGLTPEQAGAALGISRRTLAVRLHRARQRLTLHLVPVPVAGARHRIGVTP
ncbi:RNA polymerase sigma factor [Nocardioides jishulii]|uniref:Sigma-70 family RNA polymerase sigma factor n=1 Tax=Nocardioides jishulii TaxID=2575440 RepID=A0A4U2YJF0_9ACTN|nr:sigma-70 family RNA polymerase sigma factor [Nocardioides jishulii]QCX26802.1 sigma-70 family RNA polymerase sigma factor [Nocardioides jishulii]TKI61286.1 sigma-70 family RNA polymerase sigma factor [Nocardioides jishulii]